MLYWKRMKKLSFFLVLVLVLLLLCPFSLTVRAECGDDINCQIDEIQREIDALKPAHERNKQELANLKDQLVSLNARLAGIAKQLGQLEEDIFDREVNLSYQEELLAARVRSSYIRRQQFSPFLLLLASGNASHLVRELSYRESVANQDRQIISQISQEILQLKEDKETLEQSRASLTNLQAQVDKQASFLSGEVEKVGSYLASLTAKQQQLLAQKTGLFSTSVGDVPLADDPNSRPDYNPGFSPAFAAFSFGAPHFKGMSQYGAYGRAKEGQSAEDILKAYYGNVRIETVDTGGSINTSVGSLPFEDNYMRGIAEMPSKWADDGGMAALEAQAIAARSYAMAYVGWRMGNRSMSGSICVTEGCQVYKSSKVGDGTWGQAVINTRGKILVSNATGEIISAWYASTSGGYQESYTTLGHSTPGFWDTKSGWEGWTSQAYEKIAESPWFYKGWYKSRSGQACGRSHPWLTAEEMADMVNAAVVYQNNKGNDEVISHIWQEDNCYSSGADVWSKAKMREEAAKYGAGATSVNGVSVTYSTGGVTSQVVFQTDKGGITVEGLSFYKAFNRRAPGAIHLKSALFNIEKK